MGLGRGFATCFIPERIYSRGLTPGINIEQGAVPLGL